MKRPNQTTTNRATGKTPSGAPSPNRRRRGALVGLAVAVVALAGGGGAWQFQRINALPDLAIPTPVMPVPNAHDDYVRATGLVVSVIGAGTPTGEPTTDSGGAGVARSGGPLPPVKARLALVARNDAAMQALRRGFTRSYLQPPERSASSLFTSGMNGGEARSLARMLAFASRTCLDAGQMDQAAAYGVDGVRFGSDLPRGGGIISRLVGGACEVMSRQPLWKIANACDAKTARTAARRLEEIERNRHPLAETLREEKYAGLTSSRDIFEQASVFEISKSIASGRGSTSPKTTPTPSLVAVPQIQTQILMKGRGRIVRDYAAYMDRVIATADAPYQARPLLPPPPSDPVNKEFFDRFDVGQSSLFLRDAEVRMMTRLLLLRFALQAYRLEHNGAFPQTLAELVQAGYLRAVPADPFAKPNASGALPPLGYRPASGKPGFVLYSVGPDGADDNGKPINNPFPGVRGKGSQVNYVEARTKGDFVVGVNAY